MSSLTDRAKVMAVRAHTLRKGARVVVLSPSNGFQVVDVDHVSGWKSRDGEVLVVARRASKVVGQWRAEAYVTTVVG